MSFAVILAISADGGLIRVILFIMVLVAVALVLAGCIIALMTLYKQLKASDRM